MLHQGSYGFVLLPGYLHTALQLRNYDCVLPVQVPLNLRTKDDKQIELTVNVNKVRRIRHGHTSV